MKKRNFHAIILSLSLALLLLPLTMAHSAGGRIEGRVTNPKGAVVVGATVAVTNSGGGQPTAAAAAKHTLTRFRDPTGPSPGAERRNPTDSVTLVLGMSNASRERPQRTAS